MRDWLTTDDKDRELLRAAEQAEYCGSLRPWRGMFARAERLAKDGLLVQSGFSVMPPHKLYVLTDKGREELSIAAKKKE